MPFFGEYILLFNNDIKFVFIVYLVLFLFIEKLSKFSLL